MSVMFPSKIQIIVLILKFLKWDSNLACFVACVASVSNRVITRKLERSFVPLPLPCHSFFFLLLSQLSRRTSRGNARYAGYLFCYEVSPTVVTTAKNLTARIQNWIRNFSRYLLPWKHYSTQKITSGNFSKLWFLYTVSESVNTCNV